VIWQKAVQLSIEIYKLTAQFPRASVSIASNIAEGYGRSTTGEYRLFLGHARGSDFELQTQLIISKALGFGLEETFQLAEELAQEVSRMLVAIMHKLNA